MATIDPLLFTVAVADAIEPFTFVYGSALELHGPAYLSPLGLIVRCVLHGRRRHICRIALESHGGVVIIRVGRRQRGSNRAIIHTKGITVLLSLLILDNGLGHVRSVYLMNSLILVLRLTSAIRKNTLTTSHLVLKLIIYR